MISSLRGMRIGIVGAARSGLGAARLVYRLGGTALLSDRRKQEELTADVASIQTPGIETEFGEHRRIRDEPFDLIVLSPGVVPSNELLRAWRSSQCDVISELEFASRCFDGDWIGVTGSNGKTTTCTLLADMLAAAGRNVKLVGNVGSAWSDALPTASDTIFVVEVSSFQLEYAPTVHPRVAGILNIFENHLDRHASLEEYTELKFRLAANQFSTDSFVFNCDDELLLKHAPAVKAGHVRFGETKNAEWQVSTDRLIHGRFELPFDEIPLPGRHNMYNAAAAAAMANQVGVDDDVIAQALRNASPVEHRLEIVRVLNGITYINDSKSTNMVATRAAVASLTQPIILLFGGRPKKESFDLLNSFLQDKVKHLVGFGEARTKLDAEITERGSLTLVEDMEQALQTAGKLAKADNIILLSPGCASFDQFPNFEIRGSRFKAMVNSL